MDLFHSRNCKEHNEQNASNLRAVNAIRWGTCCGELGAGDEGPGKI